MRSKLALVVPWLVVAAIFAVKQREVSGLKNVNATLEHDLAEARAPKPEDPSITTIAATELQKLKDEHAELIKLRGDVTALRKEKEDWQKQSASLKAAAAAASARKVEAPKEAPQSALDSVLNSAANVKGSVAGNLRRKILNHEPLNETEQALIGNLTAKSAEIEKSPADFAAFQSANIGAFLGWGNGDPRTEQLQQILTRASAAANERGFNYNAPSVNAPAWDEAQKQLDARATGVVKNLLTPEEKALFENSFKGVLGIDFGAGPTTR